MYILYVSTCQSFSVSVSLRLPLSFISTLGYHGRFCWPLVGSVVSLTLSLTTSQHSWTSSVPFFPPSQTCFPCCGEQWVWRDEHLRPGEMDAEACSVSSESGEMRPAPWAASPERWTLRPAPCPSQAPAPLGSPLESWDTVSFIYSTYNSRIFNRKAENKAACSEVP